MNKTPIDAELRAPSGLRTQTPAIPAVNDSNLMRAVSAIKEIVEIREGQRGSKYEQAVTWRDLAEMRVVARSTNGWGNAVLQQDGDKLTLAQPIRDALELEIRNSAAYKRLMARVGSDEDMKGLPEEVIALLKTDLLEEARQRGAAIRELETIIQNTRKSFAMRTSELTASINQAHAGVRQITYAYANQNEASAGQITTIKARLDNFGGTGVTVEQKMTATVNRIDGMSGVYSVKMGANGKFAGFQLAVDAPVGSTPYSSFLIDADKFALFTNGGNFSPFGADASGWYLNGTGRINANGLTLSQLATNASVPSTTFIGSFASAPAGTKNQIYKNTSDGATYIHNGTSWAVFVQNGTNGINGNNGTSGARGSQIFYATGTPWAISDAEAAAGGANDIANSTVTAITGSSTRIIGDTVTIRNSGGTAVATRYWGGSAWLKPGVTLDGNLLVNGSISTNSLSSSLSILTNGEIKARGQNSNLSSVWGDNPNTNSYGVAGTCNATGGTGVFGIGTAQGVYGSSPSGKAIYGDTSTGYAVYGISSSSSGVGGYFTAVSGYALQTSGKSLFQEFDAITLTSESSSSSYSAGVFRNTGSNKTISLGGGSYSAYSGSGDGKIYILDGSGPFTGFHDALIDVGINVAIGDVVVDTAVVYKHDINNTLTEVEPCSAAYQKTVAGVVSEVKDPDNYLEIPYELWWEIAGNKKQLAINALGEGQVNVCGCNGNIVAGDLITTSPITGKGMRADDTTPINQVVGKSRESVSFSSVDEVKTIACFYMCG